MNSRIFIFLFLSDCPVKAGLLIFALLRKQIYFNIYLEISKKNLSIYLNILLYILQIFLYYFIQGLKNLLNSGIYSPRQRDFFVSKI